MAELDFGELLSRAAEGDEVAWRILVRALSALVLRIARSYRLGEADAFDVCQSTWLKLAQLPTGLRDPARLPSWLATTARRQALRILTARRREIPCADQEPHDAERSPEAATLTVERDRVLWQTIERLPERHRELMHLLADPAGLTHVEIAAKLGVAPGTIGPLRRRALDRLRRALEAQGYDHA
ncbi:sigma-70 family RNA polymerase sigma factor [Amycolatopsis acidiphila]|uniref:Sigma-70 family RNA polymerase sigma factor n=1 Tax=Amycolatopsis acidiphila TaxID=715473 RepID=A0A558AN57_9PSEU|nr:sigma-70 family RNA polymerase sigma factor [Amycolatopsis acidiphila]TVT25698.1 sigma-70 family RNA polymerase sigma factor [Amycolatopsis acidiphila]UIJ60457.1 sigma-70 family RNA polymerase sigma factor [Amycolatopsis acidiphila]GHG82795.1 RNA polymerase sigma factor [Amycolatopsis acidiphila]